MPNLPNIVRHPQLLGGKPTFEGTRVSVELVLNRLGAGWSEKDIYESLPTLPPGGIQAACAYAANVLDARRDILIEEPAGEVAGR